MAQFEKIEKAASLRDRGILTEEEFQREKARLMAETDVAPAPPAPRAAPPESGMTWAILATVLCFLPFGVVAIVKAGEVSQLWYAGHEERARAAAKSSERWAVAAAITGVILFIAVVILAALDERYL